VALNAFEGRFGDDAVPIGAEDALRSVHLTRIERKNGHLVYGSEVELTEAPNYPLSAQTSLIDDGSGPRQLQCREIRAIAGSEISAGDTAVICAYPYAMDWFGWSGFKPSLHDALRREHQKRAAEEAKMRLATADSPGQVLNELEFDPFETRPNRLTARFVDYTRTRGARVSVRSWRKLPGDLRPANPNRRPRARDKELWLYGVISDFDQAVEELKNSEQARELLYRADSESILDAPVEGAPGLSLPVAKAIFQALAPQALEASIHKALAGRPPDDVSRQIGGAFCIGWRVQELIDYLFRNAMRALAKRLGAIVVSRNPLVGRETGEPPAASPLSPEADVDRFIVMLEESLQQEPVPVPQLWSVACSQLVKGAIEEGCLLVRALFRMGHEVPPEVMKALENLSEGSSNVSDVLAELRRSPPH